MKVKFATQVLSRSVAAGLRYFADGVRMTKEAQQTAAVVERVDRIFDLLNSSKMDVHEQKRAINSSVLQQRLAEFREMREFVSSWKFVDKESRREVPLALVSAVKTSLHAVEKLAQDLVQQHAFQVVNTRRLNQDCVEHLFSEIRAHNGYNPTPTIPQVHTASKSITMRHLLRCRQQSVTAGANCEDDVDPAHMILRRSQIKNSTAVSGTAAASTSAAVGCRRSAKGREAKADAVSHLYCKDNSLRTQDKDIVNYIGGYLAKKLQLPHDCPDCHSLLYSQQLSDLHRAKMHRFGSQPYNFVCLSQRLDSIMQIWENCFTKSIDMIAHINRVSDSLHRKLQEQCPQTLVCTSGHDQTSAVRNVYVTFRLKAYCRFRNRSIPWQQRAMSSKLRRLNVRHK